MKRLLQFIQGTITITYGLPISRVPFKLSFSDSDLASYNKLASGYCSFLGNTLVLWPLKLQSTVSCSSIESEYRAIAQATADVVWLRRLLGKFNLSLSELTTLFCDNISAISLANNLVCPRTKHIAIDFHFIRDYIKFKDIQVHHIDTRNQVADIFTKASPTIHHQQLRDKLTIQPWPPA